MERARRLWDEWDSHCRDGRKPLDLLAELPDETLVEMASIADPRSRRYELNLLLTELKNRFARLRRLVDEGIAIAETLADATERRIGAGARILEFVGTVAPAGPLAEGREVLAEARRETEEARTRLRALREAIYAKAREPLP